ncbi:Reticulon-4-interacting protein 1 homolog [Durusdinium trenchii]|uniref:Mitochondrial n=1 Tax=Durusdinium trenchii TaxID=1381693 RepID=A0ABP0KJY0_9DINO
MDTLKGLIMKRQSFRTKESGSKMTGMVYTKDSMQMVDDLKVPKLTTTQVLVKVYAAGLNAVDEYKRRIPMMVSPDEPVGVEMVGRVEKLGWVGGDKVHMFPIAVGDEVLGMVDQGGLSEYVVAEASKITFMPETMPPEQAAAFPVAGLTAFQGLTFNKFSEGKKILVIGASDPAGAMFVKQAQLLKAGEVVVADVPEKLDALGELGVEEVLDLEEAPLAESLEGRTFDLIVDCMSEPQDKLEEGDFPMEKKCKSLLASGGRFMALNAKPIDQVRKLIANSVGLNVQRKGFDTVLVRPKSEEMKQLAEWFQEGLLEQPIDSVVPFEEGAIIEAYEKIKTKQTKGKMIVEVSKRVVH